MIPPLVLIQSVPPGVVLSARERARMDGFPSAKRKHDWELGRAAGKLAVAGLLEAEGASVPEWGAIEVETTPSGAPHVVGELGGPVAISLTHGHGMAGALALRPGPGGSLPGLDLERVRPRRDEGLRFFLSDAEQAHVLSAPRLDASEVSPRDRLAILYWALKEAGFKALQPPRGLGLLDVGVELLDDWAGAEGQAEIRYRRAAAKRHASLGGGRARAGWLTPEPGLIVAWVTVEAAPLPE